jgi:hypothetical protein
MRIRQTKPEFYKHVGLGEVSRDARYLFKGLWHLADCAGRMQDQPKRIKVEIFPYDEDLTTQDIDGLLNELASHEEKFITRYEVDGIRYLQVNNFNKHQHLMGNELKAESKYPEPNNNNTSATCYESVNFSTYSVQTSTSEERINGLTGVTEHTECTSGEVVSFSKPEKKKSNNHVYSEEFEIWWQAYPNRQDKIKTFQLWKKALQTTTVEVLLKGAEDYAKKCLAEKTEKRYQKHSTTFLNAGGWEGDHTPSVPASGPYRPQGTILPGTQITPADQRVAGLVKDF